MILLIFVILLTMIDLLVDTNVLIYVFDEGSMHHQIANSILLNPNYKLFITTKNISEFFAVTSKIKIDHQRCLNFYLDLKSNFTILFPSLESLFHLEKLIQQYHPKGNLVFDLEIVSVMLANEIQQIATFNQKDFLNINEVQLLKLS